METLRILLSDKVVMAMPMVSGAPVIIRDADLPGFFVIVGAKRKTYMVQADLRCDRKRQTVRIKIGNVGKLSSREVRAKAKVLLGSIADGIDPRVESKRSAPVSPTFTVSALRDAWASYRDSHTERKGRSDGTIASYRDHLERLLKDWLDEPLGKFGKQPILVKQPHDLITRANGPHVANGGMRSFRAIYNRARKTERALPTENPVSAIDWNNEKRRNSARGPSDHKVWFDQLGKLENPVRREFHLFALLSGSRPDVIKRASRTPRSATAHAAHPKA